MFTGIIEAFGIIHSIERQGTNVTFRILSPISNELKVDQSVSHNGVCLTVEDVKEGVHSVTAIEETLKKTNLLAWEEGTLVNLERCMTMNGRIDGHIVQGHVDTTAICTEKKDADGSWEFSFQFPKQFSPLVIEKGSISLNGISLTIFNVDDSSFSVAIIPYTYSHTNIQQVKEGSTVNIEFDIIGKYVNRMLALPK
jgi:riboflavin synthase